MELSQIFKTQNVLDPIVVIIISKSSVLYNIREYDIAKLMVHMLQYTCSCGDTLK